MLVRMQVGNTAVLPALLPGVTEEPLILTVVEKTAHQVVAKVTYCDLLLETITCRISQGQALRIIQNPAVILGS